MASRPTILLVEDDDFAAEFAMELLATDYVVHRTDNGRSALDAFSEIEPDLVLLDVSMPGLSGYDVCRILRTELAVVDLPIIFLSGKVSKEERLTGYEVGGDDYLTKPVVAEELISKIRLAINQHAEHRRLKSDVSNAVSTAMTAMSSAAELGEVLKFVRRSFNCPDYIALSREMLDTIGSLGLDASVQIRGKKEVVSRTADGSCSPLEESVLNNMSTQGRIFEFGSRTSFTFDHITIIAKNFPRNDPDRQGRMRDSLALLAEGADARVITLDKQVVLAKQHGGLMHVIASTREALREIEHNLHTQCELSRTILQDFLDELERSFIRLGIKDTQVTELAELAHQATKRELALYNEGLAMKERMQGLLKKLDNTNS